MTFAEYIWLDGVTPTQGLRSKTRVVKIGGDLPTPEDFPDWTFDGSATDQADDSNSDCALKPVCVVKDPTREGAHYLVLCEVFNPDGSKHVSNTRGTLRAVLHAGAAAHDPWIGFEQAYTLIRDHRPLGFPKEGYPTPQGPYYCSIGADRAFGREIAETHARYCQEAGLIFYGLNAEVMPGQWEFQIGYRGQDSDDPSLLNAADHLWLARYLLHRVAEKAGLIASLANKPMKGDWNGAGMHTNFSTIATRAEGGIDVIRELAGRLKAHHAAHIAVYGEGLAERLTGLRGTCAITEFRIGNADRSASIRIPLSVEHQGCGYFEDRRPGANADPYTVAARLALTVCGLDEALLTGGRSGA
jgi:glutamine synthetase